MARGSNKENPSDLIARKEYKKAISLCTELLKKKPEDLPTKFCLADALLADDQTEEALRQYNELAQNFAEKGHLMKAIAVCKKILKVRPDSKEVKQLLADLADKNAEGSASEKNATTLESETTPKLGIDAQLLKNLSYEEFRQFVRDFILHHYDEETIIVKEGDPGASLFIIVRGEVRVTTKDTKKREVVLSNLGEGEFFGEVALLTGKPRTATVITNMGTDLLELSRAHYQRLISKYPRVKNVVEGLHKLRAHKTIEAMIQAYHERNPQ